jgi:hypothetical protein
MAAIQIGTNIIASRTNVALQLNVEERTPPQSGTIIGPTSIGAKKIPVAFPRSVSS